LILNVAEGAALYRPGTTVNAEVYMTDAEPKPKNSPDDDSTIPVFRRLLEEKALYERWLRIDRQLDRMDQRIDRLDRTLEHFERTNKRMEQVLSKLEERP